MTNQSAPKPAAPAFTPGPWAMYPILTGGFRVKAYDGRDAWTWIADVSPVIKDDSGDASEEGVANARLIASAPEMYEALRDLIEYASNADAPLRLAVEAGPISRARAALRRARGEGDQK